MTFRKPLFVGLGILLVPVALVVVAALGFLGFVQTEPGGRWLADRLGSALGGPDAEVRVEGVEVGWPLDLRARRVVVADDAGPWLEMSGFVLDWSPTRLLAGTFAADRLAAEQVVVLREPAPATTPAEVGPDQGALPGLPFAVDVDSLETELVISERLAGRRLSLGVEGRADMTGGDARVDLRLRRTDGVAASGHALVDWNAGAGTLEVDVAIDEAIGAVLARLVPGGGVPPMAIRIAGEGPAADWRGTVLATTGEITCLDATVALSAGEVAGVRGEGLFRAACLPGTVAGDLLGEPPARFAGAATATAEAIAIESFRVESESGVATVSGTIADTLALNFSLDAGDVARFAALAGVAVEGPARMQGTLTGTADLPVVQVDVASAAGSAAGLSWTGLGAELLVRRLPPDEGGAWSVGGSGRLATAQGLPGPLGGPLDIGVSAQVDDARALVRVADLRLRSGDSRLSLMGVIRDWGRDVDLHGLVQGRRLEQFADLAGLDIAGRGTVRLAIRGDLVAPRMQVGLVGATARFRTGVAQVDQLLGSSPEFSGQMAISPDAVPILRATLTGRGAMLALGGRMAPHLGLGWRLRVPDLAVLAVDGLSGEAAAAGYVLGRAAAPAVGAIVSAEGRPTAASAPVQVVAALGFDELAPAATGILKAGLRSGDLRAEMRTGFALGEAVALNELTIYSGTSGVTGDLVVQPSGSVTGTLSGTVDDLAPWAELAGMPLAGRLTVDATLDGEGGSQNLAGTFEGAGLVIGDNAAGSVEGRLDLRDVATAPSGSASMTARDLGVAGLRFATADLAVEGTGESIAFDLDAGGGDGQALAAEGVVSPLAGDRTVRLRALTFADSGIAARLVEPTTVVLAADGYRLAPTVLDVGDGRVALSGSLTGDEIAARLDIDRMPMAIAEAFLPGRKATGVLAGEVRVSGTVAQPQAVAELRGRGLGFTGTAGERIDARASLRWRDGRLAVQAEASGARGLTASLDGTVPLVLGPGGPTVPAEGALRASLVADGDVERLSEALPLAGHRFAGTLRADIEVAGTVGRPQVDGAATLRDGYYQFFETGTVLRDVQARLTATDSETFTLRLEGVDGRRKGRLVADGTITSGAAGLGYDVAMRMSDFRVVDLDGAQAQAAGALDFEGIGDAAGLTGRISIGPAEYDISQRLPGGGSVPTMEVVEINRPGEDRRRQVAALRDPGEAPGTDAPGVETPMTVSLSIQTEVDRLFVRGQGLDSVWGGGLVIGGTLSEPTVVGDLTAARGTFDFAGRSFQLADSRIVFDGGRKLDPRLDVVAQSQARDLTVKVLVTGTAASPTIDLASEPSYPKDEILARMLFGKQIGQLSVAQQVQIARAAASLTGGGGFDPIGNIRQALGLDLLEIGAEDEEDGLSPRVAVGKYLDEDTFVRVEEGGEGGQVSIERQLGRGLSVEAEVGRKGGGGIGLNWRRDY